MATSNEATSPEGVGAARTSLSVVVGASALVVCVAGVLQLTRGEYPMSPATVVGALADPAVWRNPTYVLGLLLGRYVDWLLAPLGVTPAQPELSTPTAVVWEIRLPRVLVATFVGAALGVSGAVFQAVTRNELASPFVLGVSSGAGFVVLVTFVFLPILAPVLPLLAGAGGLVAFLLVYAIAWQGGTNPVRLVLAGIVVTMIFKSLQRGLFFFVGDVATVQRALSWTTGSLLGATWGDVRLIVPSAVVTCTILALSARQLDVLQLGERTARSLGMAVERVRFGLAGLAVLAASASVAAAGVVTFVGLIVPHVVRTLVGPDHRKLILGCLAVGPALVLGADAVGRLALSRQLPVGVVTGLVGGPYFLYLMRTRESIGQL